jgi:hypothetical protein
MKEGVAMVTSSLTVFESVDSKERLITVLISALVALTVVLINQKLTNIRENRALRAKKIEELFTAATELNKLFKTVVCNYRC